MTDAKRKLFVVHPSSNRRGISMWEVSQFHAQPPTRFGLNKQFPCNDGGYQLAKEYRDECNKILQNEVAAKRRAVPKVSKKRASPKKKSAPTIVLNINIFVES
jgi:hypothetical protein